MLTKRIFCFYSLVFTGCLWLLFLFYTPERINCLEEGDTLQVMGKVTWKEYKEGTAVLTLRQLEWKLGETVPEGILCYIKMPQEELPEMGSFVLAAGTVRKWEEARNPGGFHQREYYQMQRLDFALENGRIIDKSRDYDRFREELSRIKAQLSAIFTQVFLPEHGAVMKAVLLGEKAELDGELKQLYQESGISHILAISGLHISLIGMGIFKLIRKTPLPYWAAAMGAGFFMYSYGCMIGMSTSAARALVMFGMQLAAKLLGRTYDMLTALSLAGLLLLLEQPLYLWNAGFLLSFGAVLGIALLQPVIKAGGLCVFLFTFPVMVFWFYEVSVYSILLNLLVIPLLTVLVAAGLLVPVFWFIGPQTAGIPALLCSMVLSFYERSCLIFRQLPGSVWRIGRPEFMQIIMYAVLLLFLIYRGNWLSVQMKAVWVAGAVFLLTTPIPVSGIQLIMMDVGQGDCFLLRTSDSTVLIDGGSSSEGKVGTKLILPVLKYYGIESVDYLFISHMDEDHCGGMRELLEQKEIRCRNVIVPRAAGYEEAYPEWRRLAKQCGGSLYRMEQGDCIRTESLTIRCIAPAGEAVFTDRNSTSLVLEAAAEGFSALFTGDVSTAEEEGFIRQLQESSYTVLKAAHHGSNYSNSSMLLERVKPEMTLVSCGKRNRYGHPGREAMKRFAKSGTAVYQTPESGAVIIKIRRGIKQVETMRCP